MQLALYVLVLLVYCHQTPRHAPTAISRLDLLHAVVRFGTLQIDAFHLNTPDKAVFQGHYYSDKAPGTAALALVPFGLAAAGLSLADVPLDSKTGWLVSSWVACAGSIGVLTALGAVALFTWLARRVGGRVALMTTLGVFLGAAPLPYATMMFSHALVVGLLCLALWAMGKGGGNGAWGVEAQVPGGGSVWPVARGGRAWRRRLVGWVGVNRWGLLAGHACGWALASEYSAGLVVMGLFGWLVFGGSGAEQGEQHSSDEPPADKHQTGWAGLLSGRVGCAVRLWWRRAWPFCVGAIPPLLLIPAYSWACFGTPFTLAYSYQATFLQMEEGLYAIKWPDAQTAFNLLFSPARGLFFWSPFFLMAGFGYGPLMQRSLGLFWLTYAVPLLQVVVISGRVWDWQAGPAWGPRLLSPMIPLLALPCALGMQRLPRLGMALAAYSIGVTTLATLTDACPSLMIDHPLTELNLPLFRKGQFSPNLGQVLGLPPYASVGLYYAVLVGGGWWVWRQMPAERAAG